MTQKSMSLCFPDQIQLVHDNHSRYTLFFCHHQETVQHAKMRLWVSAGEYQYHLVRIRDQYLLVFCFWVRRHGVRTSSGAALPAQ